MVKKFDRVEVSQDVINKALKEFSQKLEEKLRKKGTSSFASPWECIGKEEEELHETIVELHQKNWPRFSEELYDIMITAFWGIASLKAQNS